LTKWLKFAASEAQRFFAAHFSAESVRRLESIVRLLHIDVSFSGSNRFIQRTPKVEGEINANRNPREHIHEAVLVRDPSPQP